MSNSQIQDCKKCKGTGQRRDVCGTCKGSGKVTVSTSADGQLVVTPYVVPAASKPTKVSK